jgi:RNA polymerase sigma factor (sigma-70 family)
MAVKQFNKVIHNLRQILDKQDACGPPDSDLLRRFVQLRDEAAFETLVRRHGPMVLGVCRRVLNNLHDAEDAFQACFLVLVRKAPGLRAPGTIGNWLYGVAYRTALHARGMALKRRVKETSVPLRTDAAEDRWSELRDLLDRELERLPEKYRSVVVLCDLEEKTRKEAARHLGWAEGTVASRLARGRCLLAKRLSRGGLALTGGALAMMLGQKAASACVPQVLLVSTIKAANLFAAGGVSTHVAMLAQGVLNSMLLTKLKTIAVVLAFTALLGAGIVGLSESTQAALSDPSGQFVPAEGQRSQRTKDGSASPDKDVTFMPLRPHSSAELVDQEVWKKASVDGKYSMLLKRIEVKDDLKSYKAFNDFGEWKGTSYAGHENLPAGYWVYVYPNWYIWGAKDAPIQKDVKKASVGGVYSILLKKIEVKADLESYKEFNDFGEWKGSSYAGHDDLPAGYWVYVYPNWYIWGDKDAKPASLPDDVKRASVGGKYKRLLKKIEVKTDLENYQEFNDYGEWQGTSYAGHDDLPAGYWVYVYPNWYIWGDKKDGK